MGFRWRPTVSVAIAAGHDDSAALDAGRVGRTFPQRHHAVGVGLRGKRFSPLAQPLLSVDGFSAVRRKVVWNAWPLHLRKSKRGGTLPQAPAVLRKVPGRFENADSAAAGAVPLGAGAAGPLVARFGLLPLEGRRVYGRTARSKGPGRRLGLCPQRQRARRAIFP